MKCVAIFGVCLLALATAIYIPDIKENDSELQTALVNNPIDELWKKALEYIRTLLQTYEPFHVPDMPEQTVTGDGISLKAKFKNVTVSKASDFTIDHIENSLFGLWAKFNVTIPQMHLEGDWSISGTIAGRQVSTSNDGHFVVDVEQLKTGGYVAVALKVAYLQMTKIDLGYSIKSLNFAQTGLKVEGLTDEELNKFFSSSAYTKYFADNEEFVCSQIAAYVKETANKIMYEKSLAGLLQWLKDVIAGKIIPTPPAA